MAFEAAEDVRDFALGGVGWQPLHVQRARGVAGQLCRQAVGARRNAAGRGAGALTGIDEPAGPGPMGPEPGPIGWYIGPGGPPCGGPP
eukprot:scaffold66551_cov53-Phaeocystis_antarctica.AAC.1